MGACGTAAVSTSGSPSNSGHPADRPSTTPSATAQPTPSGTSRVVGSLAPDGIAETVTTDLVVRSLPEISDASVIDPVRMPIGFLAYIVDGPVGADGYDWYQVAPFPPTLSDVVEDHPAFGWLAAAGKDGQPWIAPWDGECPQTNWDGMMLSQRFVALSCWGGAEITLEGTLRCDPSSQPGGEPTWLWTVPCRLIGPDYGDLLAGGIGLQFAPDVEAFPRGGTRVRVAGHLDDPAAETCTLVPSPGGLAEAPHPELVRLWCRLAFVATEITQL
jgi:hypothetical protein